VRPAARRLAACIAVSEAAAEYARRGTGRRADVIPNGIDYELLAGIEPRRGGRRILFVGRDEPRKGLEVLRRAHRRVDAQLVLVGPDGGVPRSALLAELGRAD